MENKIVIFPQPQKKIVVPVKEKTKRIITQHNSWKSDISFEKQLNIIETFFLKETEGAVSPPPEIAESCKLVKKQIHQKIMGYKHQDLNNNIFNETEFIDFEKVIELLYLSKLTCYYCQSNVFILYDFVRESNQWTLERLDNKLGHNYKNLVVSCLTCNLRRRTMYHERFLYTKQIGKQKIIKLSKVGSPPEDTNS